MKKNFFKKLSVVLALAMTVTAIAPAATETSAAAAPAFKSKSATVKVGQTKNYGMSNVTAYSVTKFVIGNKKIATVKKSGKTAKVTGVAEGKTTLRADLKAYKSKKEVQARLPVTVVTAETGLTSVVQTTSAKIVATFGGAVPTGITASDFSLVRDDNVVFSIKSVEIDSTNANRVTITTYSDMKDGKTYTLTYNNKTASFVATDGTVTGVNVTPLTITAGKEKTIYVQTTDAKGIVLSENEVNDVAYNMEVEVKPASGYYVSNDSKLYLSAVGDTATVSVTYHTYKYENGVEVGAITKDFTITGVLNDATVSKYQYSIATEEPAWDATSFSADQKVKVGTDKQTLYIRIKDSNGDEISNYDDYTVSSSDTSKLLVDETMLSGSAIPVNITGVSTGTAYVVVKNTSTGATITTLPITVVAASKVASINLSATSLSISSGAGLEKTITVTPKDQYGDDMTDARDGVNISLEVTSIPRNSALIDKGAINGTGITVVPGSRDIKVNGNEMTADGRTTDYGYYTIKVTAEVINGDSDKDTTKVSRSFTVNLVDAKGSSTYKLEGDTSIDLVVESGTDSAKTSDIRFVEVKSGVPVKVLPMTSVKVKRTGGDTYVDSADSTVTKAISAEALDRAKGINGGDGKLVISATTKHTTGNGDYYKKRLDKGNYTVTATATGADGKEKTCNLSFTVKDTQPAASAKILKTNCDSSDLVSFLKNTDNAEFIYEGMKQETGFEIKSFDSTSLSSSSSIYVKSADIWVKIPGSSNYTNVTATINKTFTNMGSIGSCVDVD